MDMLTEIWTLKQKGGVMLSHSAVKMVVLLIVGILLTLPAKAEFNQANPDSIPFLPAVNYPTGDGPHTVFCADLDGDDDLDLAVTNEQGHNGSILKNNGNGTFYLDNNFSTGYYPQAVFCMNIDGDSDLDLAVANWMGAVSILKNNGDGTFYLDNNYSPGGGRSIFSADLDGDGDLDLAVATEGAYNVSILKNNGDGTFYTDSSYATGYGPSSYVFCADLDADSNLDLAVTNHISNTVSILKNIGDGTFYLDSNYATGNYPQSVFCADLDGNGYLDLAVANAQDNNVSILQNKGDGTFESKVDYAAGDGARSVFCEDLDGDGDLDLAVVNEGDQTVSILRNNGDGTFGSKVDYGVGANAYCVFCADLDGDGDLDLAVTNLSDDNVSILKNLTREHANALFVGSDTVCLDPRLHKVPLVVKNLDTLKAMTIPLHPEITCTGFTIDSVSFAGTRIENWEEKTVIIGQDSLVLGLVANLGGGTPPLLPGEGAIAYIYYTIDCDTAHTGETCSFSLDTTTIQPENQHLLFVDSHDNEFIPYFEQGTTTVNLYRPGDVNCNCELNIGDVVGIINYLFKNGAEPCPMDAGDIICLQLEVAPQ